MVLAHCTFAKQHQVFHPGRFISTTMGNLKLPVTTVASTVDYANQFAPMAYSGSGAM